MRIILLASGSGTLVQTIIDANLDLEILAVISDRQSKALDRAMSAGIACKHLPMKEERELWNHELFEYIEALTPDLVVSVGFMRILSENFVENFRTINTHPALLPNFPGAHAVRDALAAGALRTGASVHWVDSGMDTGEVITQKEIDILPEDEEASLHERIKITERRLIVEVLERFILNGIPGRT